MESVTVKVKEEKKPRKPYGGKRKDEGPKPQPGKFPVLISATMMHTIMADERFEVAPPDLDMISYSMAYMAKQKTKHVNPEPPSFAAAGLLATGKKLLLASGEPLHPNSLEPLEKVKFDLPSVMHQVVNCVGEYTARGKHYIPQNPHVAAVRSLIASVLVESRVSNSSEQAWNSTRALQHDKLLDQWKLPLTYSADWSRYHIDALNQLYTGKKLTTNIASGSAQVNAPQIAVTFPYPTLANAPVVHANVPNFVASNVPASFVRAYPNANAMIAAYVQPLEGVFPHAQFSQQVVDLTPHIQNNVLTLNANMIQILVNYVSSRVYRIMEAVKKVGKTFETTSFDSTGAEAQRSQWIAEEGILVSEELLAGPDISAGVIGKFIRPKDLNQIFVTSYQDRQRLLEDCCTMVFS